jgi:hypothetical protein
MGSRALIFYGLLLVAGLISNTRDFRPVVGDYVANHIYDLADNDGRLGSDELHAVRIGLAAPRPNSRAIGAERLYAGKNNFRPR